MTPLNRSVEADVITSPRATAAAPAGMPHRKEEGPPLPSRNVATTLPTLGPSSSWHTGELTRSGLNVPWSVARQFALGSSPPTSTSTQAVLVPVNEHEVGPHPVRT